MVLAELFFPSTRFSLAKDSRSLKKKPNAWKINPVA
jgi:hypothetical protein